MHWKPAQFEDLEAVLEQIGRRNSTRTVKAAQAGGFMVESQSTDGRHPAFDWTIAEFDCVVPLL